MVKVTATPVGWQALCSRDDNGGTTAIDRGQATMRISDMILHLVKTQAKHGNLLCVTSRFSDYQEMDEGSVVEATRVGGQDWLIHTHPTMAKGTPTEKCLYFPGN